MRTPIVLLLLAVCCHAETVTFGEGENAFEIEFALIGNPGNADDPRVAYSIDSVGRFVAPPYHIGRVDYDYDMAKFELSCDAVQIVSRLGALSDSLPNDYCTAEGLPAYLSRKGAVEFVNWLNTSKGFHAAYKPISDSTRFELWQEGEPGFNPEVPLRNSLAKYYLPSADEFHKAAFYDPEDEVWLDYAIGSNERPTPVASGTDPGTAVIDKITFSTDLAPVERAGGLSAFGTMGQTGNSNEWEEGFVWERSGVEVDEVFNSAFASNSRERSFRTLNGFRVVAVTPVPEPSSLTILAFALCSLGAFRSRLYASRLSSSV